MFYYPNVLQRHSGCFSTIWLAATRGIKIPRRDFLKVNVNRTCGDILDYVTAQVPPAQPHLPRPRFSLYLSSQLQYGVVVVYHKQCGFLLDEVQQTIERLLRSKTCTCIDMAEPDRLALDVPDILMTMEAAEGAQDPFFGLMASHQLPSPYKILQLVSEEASSQRPLVSSPHAALDMLGFRSPPAAIALTEREQIAAAECFEGDELPEATEREIDLLMDQPDHFSREETGERTRGHEGAMSSIDQLKETLLGAERDTLSLLGDEWGHPAEVPLAAVAVEMTPQRVAMPTPPSGASGEEGASGGAGEQVLAPPLRRSRRRQLVFADPQVQISERAMKAQITKPLAETLELSEVLLDFPCWTRRVAPAQLFSAPCGSLLHADLLSLWKQSASLTVLPGGGEQEEEEEEARGESEQDREILRMERKRRRSSMREISIDSGLQPADGSSVMDEDRSMSDVIAPFSRLSPQEEAQLRMDPIAEERVDMPEAQAETRDMLSCISSSLQRFAEVTFGSLVPAEADRSAAAHWLYTLLELASARQVTVRQREPYSDIIITPAALA